MQAIDSISVTKICEMPFSCNVTLTSDRLNDKYSLAEEGRLLALSRLCIKSCSQALYAKGSNTVF